MNGTLGYLLGKRYTDESLDGVGALKGVPCTISDISSITDEGVTVGKRVTFQWTSNSGVVSTSTMDVMYGEDGRGILSVDSDAAGNIVITYDDGETEIVPITLSFASLQFVETLPASGNESVIYLVPTGVEGVCSMYIWSVNQWVLVGSTQIDMSQYYTKTQTNALLDEKVDVSEVGVAGGVAELDANGKVPSSQLPSYVDDTVEGYLNEVDGKFYAESTYETEIPGETGKIYVTLDTNKSYRWSGSRFVEISEGLALGETSSTAYAGNKGKKNADDIADLTALAEKIQDDIAPVESGTTSSAAYAVGDLLLLNGTLYKAKTAIAIGDTFTVGTNIETTTLDSVIQSGGGGVLPGGTAGQLLVKQSSTDGDVAWKMVREEMTYAQYQALTAEQKNDGTIRFVPDAPGGGGGSLETELTVSKSTGGIESGTVYAVGTSYDLLWHDLLDPVAYPTLTAPSASLTATGVKLLETGSTLSTTMTIAFNRGSISPAYGTSGYRSGAAIDYTLADGTPQSTNTFSVTVTSAKTSYQGSVSYAAGEQPKDSKGNNYSTPLAAGSVNTNTLSYEFVDALWANTSAITTVAKLALVSKSTKLKRFDFPAQTIANPEIFDVPASWTVTAVEVLNTLSNQWEDCSSEFTITDTTHNDASGTSVAYKRYTDNRGYNAGARAVRIKWS